MRKKVKAESGAIAIEAVLGITAFMMAICTLLFLSYLVRIEARVQYAVDQTAKELSSYYYLVDALELSELFSGSYADSRKEDINSILNGVMDVSSSANTLVSGIDLDFSNISEYKEASVEAYNKAKDVYTGIKTAAQDPQGVMKGIIVSFVHSGNKMITPFLCRLVFSKYIGENANQQKKFFEMTGMENGVDDINFLYSSLIEDGRTVTVTAIYKVNLKKLSFGLLDYDLTFCNTASTAAWLKPKGIATKTLADAYKYRTEKAKKEE